MDLFDANITELLYAPAQSKLDESESLKPEIKRIDPGELVEGYTPPDRVIGACPNEFISPISHRTHRDMWGGRLSVYGNMVEIDSNLPTYRDMALPNDWLRSPQEYKCVNGKIKKVPRKGYVPPIRQKGDIKGMSKDSRRRLLKKVNKVDSKNRRPPYWITLTYPNRFPTNPEEYKAD